MIGHFETSIAMKHIITVAPDLSIDHGCSSGCEHLCHFHVSVNGQQHILTGLVEEELPHVTIEPEQGMIIFTFTRVSWTGLRASLALSPPQNLSRLQLLYPQR